MIKKDEIGLIITSLNNPFFSKKKNLDYLNQRANQIFNEVYFLIPWQIMIHSYKAMKKDDKKATQIAIKKRNNLTNKMKGFNIIDYDSFKNNPLYLNEEKFNFNLFYSSSLFKDDINYLSKSYLKDKINLENIEDALDEAKNFPIKEISTVSAFQKIKNKKVTLINNKEFELYKNYIFGKYNGKKRNNLDFLIIN